jgi:tetratricopeptide (TPR) repeat protein
VAENNQSSPEEIRNQAIAAGQQLFILVRPDACPVCAMHRGKTYWADEAPELPIGGCMKFNCRCEYRAIDPSGPSVEEMLNNGIAAVKAGQMEQAQEWLIALLQIDRYNEQGWLWLSGTADDDQDRLDCIQEVLKINPDNTFAQRGLAALQAKGLGLPEPEEPETDESEFPEHQAG